MRKKKKNAIIKHAIDSYPGGICFSTANGRIILANKTINDLVLEITGHTILNAVTLWNELSQAPKTGTTRRLVQSWLPKRATIPKIKLSSQLFFKFSDNSIWRFEYTFLDEETVQIEAVDITDLYILSEELYENSIKLREMQDRQKKLLENIVEVNKNKELLAAKMRVHDELGKCLLVTNKAISTDSVTESSDALIESWRTGIQSFLNASADNIEKNTSLQDELFKVAELIGCEIIFIGQMPAEQKVLHLLFAAIREALTNAVRHANATKLNVSIKKEAEYYHIEISDNGDALLSDITEGTGLGALREQLTQNDANMSVLCEDHVILLIDIPYNIAAQERSHK